MKKKLPFLMTLAMAGLLLISAPKGNAEELNPIEPVLIESFRTQEGVSASSSSMILLAQSDGSAEETEDELDLFEEYEEGNDQTISIADPLYGFNYAMYTLNDFFYFYALKPVARGYGAVVPTIARKGINNFFHNLLFPVRFVNNVLQGKLDRAGDEVGIFLANSTAGVLGFNPVAQKHLGMKTSEEDLGQTLGSWKIGNGFYIVLPILGPSTLRDALGDIGDSFITPVNYAEPWELYWGATATDKINRTSFRIGDYEALKEASLDPYVAIRNAYIQNRSALIEK
ncbi:MlaA family lipoprotein [Desulfospira joergensenii]|uniref:MlaA family lipoprotein n=1 Tax=Desulfospira joergensenii TaxID=53329 RepID=UPI0003B3E738|nr:VacJ family lipoprotein [Desulfospira joergensenii]